jgi:ribonuclease BN (tRNA processing enzyme)
MAAGATGITATILGSGTGVPSLSRSACALLAETAGARVLFDCGPGTMRRLLEAGCGIFDLTHIFLSHFHPDHTAELVPLLFATRNPAAGPGRRAPLTLVAGRGFAGFFARLKAAYGDWIDIGPGMLAVIELETGGPAHRDFPDFAIDSAPVDHSPESLAFRLTARGGRSLVYSGDTDFTAGLAALARRADLFVCECATPEGHKVRGHLTPGEAGELASRAEVGTLVLTHFYPVCENADIAAECRRTWSGPLALATDLAVFRL